MRRIGCGPNKCCKRTRKAESDGAEEAPAEHQRQRAAEHEQSKRASGNKAVRPSARRRLRQRPRSTAQPKGPFEEQADRPSAPASLGHGPIAFGSEVLCRLIPWPRTWSTIALLLRSAPYRRVHRSVLSAPKTALSYGGQRLSSTVHPSCWRQSVATPGAKSWRLRIVCCAAMTRRMSRALPDRPAGATASPKTSFGGSWGP